MYILAQRTEPSENDQKVLTCRERDTSDWVTRRHRQNLGNALVRTKWMNWFVEDDFVRQQCQS